MTDNQLAIMWLQVSVFVLIATVAMHMLIGHP